MCELLSLRVVVPRGTMDTEQFIVLVQENPAIYDPFHPKHRDRDVIAAIWKTIAQAMDTTDERVRKKWHNLRSNYMREKRREKDFASGFVAQKKLSWSYFKQLQFLDATMQQRLSSGSVSPPEYDEDYESNTSQKFKVEENVDSDTFPCEIQSSLEAPSVAEIGPTPAKQKRIQKTGHSDIIDMEFMQQLKTINKYVEENSDPDRLFLLSLLPVVKQLSLLDNLEFKAEVITLLKNKLYCIHE